MRRTPLFNLGAAAAVATATAALASCEESTGPRPRITPWRTP